MTQQKIFCSALGTIALQCCLLLMPVAPLRAAENVECDVVVYAGTAGGVMAAVAAARHGAKALILEPGRHLGGMVSGGLGHTDVLRQEKLIGGLAAEFFQRVGRHYGKPIAWDFEPHVAEDILKDMVCEAGVQVRYGARLVAVTKRGTSLRSLRSIDGVEVVARVFIDASYEGDLMKAAGVSYVVGREGKDRYGESLAGRGELLPGHHQFAAAVLPWKDDKLLPYITPQDKLAPTGAGDGKFQAYCFRLCLTDVPENRLSITKPDGYDPLRYEMLRRSMASGASRTVLGIARIPNGKCDVNSDGPVSTNLLGAAWEYPEATPERRAEIWEEHRSWAHGLLYFLQNDPSVPEKMQKGYRDWGLCKDEYRDTGGWPHQLYVREARRMIGQYVLTQHDLQVNRRKNDVIAMAGYNIDIREVQWVSVRTFLFPKAEDRLFMEGYLSEPVDPWDIPYGAILPKCEECDNLLVPVCLSASTIAYASFRMEPNYMAAGHAAGVAASIAIKQDAGVDAISLAELQTRLREEKQILTTGKHDNGDDP